MTLRSFPPVLARDARVLILGSFPSEASLAAAQYYAHPRNQFWRLLGALLNEPLPALDYATRLERVLAHRFAILRRLAPLLDKVCFNGKTAGRFEPVLHAAGYRTLVLPSSSPAFAMRSFEQKLRIWRNILL
jgi:TDG/mug DNA glycosylase family protein